MKHKWPFTLLFTAFFGLMTILEAFSTRGGLERDGIYLSIEEEEEKKLTPKWLAGCEVFRCCNLSTANKLY